MISTDAISSETTDQCECCGHYKKVRMYIIPTGEAAWICAECRVGKKPNDRPAPGR